MPDEMTYSYTSEGEDHIITTGWFVWNGVWADIMDAPTRGKALFGSSCWTDNEDHYSLAGYSVRRRRDIDGKTFEDARYIAWPCDQRPCPGCSCCMDGVCGAEDYDD
jgi:hypothetical protein